MSKKNNQSNTSNSTDFSKRRFERLKDSLEFEYWNCSPETYGDNMYWNIGKDYVDRRLKEAKVARKLEQENGCIIGLVIACIITIVIATSIMHYLTKNQVEEFGENVNEVVHELTHKETAKTLDTEKSIIFWNPVINNYYTGTSKRFGRDIIIVPEENIQVKTDQNYIVVRNEEEEEDSETAEEVVNPAELEDHFEEAVIDYTNRVVATYKKVKITGKDLQEIKAVARAEGGHNCYRSQRAIASTILERAATRGQSIHTVITSPGQYCAYGDGSVAALSKEEIENAHEPVIMAIYQGPGDILKELRKQAKAKGLDLEKYAGDGPIYFCSATDGTPYNELENRANIKVKAVDPQNGLFFYRYWDQ